MFLRSLQRSCGVCGTFLASVKAHKIRDSALLPAKLRCARDNAVGVLETSGKARSVRGSSNNSPAFAVFQTVYVSRIAAVVLVEILVSFILFFSLVFTHIPLFSKALNRRLLCAVLVIAMTLSALLEALFSYLS